MANAAFAEAKRAESANSRAVPASLPARQSLADAKSLLLGSTWLEHHPNKRVSRWDTRVYTFANDGTLERTGDLAIKSETLRWKIVLAGKRPILTSGKARLALEPCIRKDKSQTLCLFGPPPT